MPPIFNYLIRAKNVSDLWNDGDTPSYYGAAYTEKGSFCQHLADCYGACSIARCRMLLRAGGCVCAYKILPVLRLLSFLPVLLPSPSLIVPNLLFLPSSFPFFLPSFLPFFLPSFPPSFTETSVDAAGGEPGWTTAQRPGPQEAAPEAGPGSPAPRPARPSL